ncbi:polysaccharide deacetylase family protein [Hydrogenophaga sp.]|uniref:polysaccharide deacetylase family protein n=1 Tax=Hydrogenophaga sp. TaxID=1904254 RepID=UPI0027307B09|nr:polysaccharide deacetylase family protein [Hydrogenophaga sp.]MDP2073787.1 polysaccharide deacetylase family protein [Hydrogenophaga sp.]MDP3106911.1 polysaccharide deacetylase family protein [Hydrogenophaga sp.]MDZ4397931.1 polysaccharide deacetylase family protein [Hydrogenophaga sp.]
MKDFLRSLAYRSGALGLWHRLRNRRALTVLMFHRVLPDGDPRFELAEREFTMSLSGFRHTLDFVVRHYNVVQLQDVQRWAQGQGELPSCPMLLTFDDGWRDTLTVAAPELQRRGCTAVLFLASEVPKLPTPRWWQDTLVQAWSVTADRSRLWAAAGLESPAMASRALWRLTAELATWPEAQRIAWLQQHAPGLVSAVGQRQMLTAEELPQVESAALELAAHGHTHAPLTLAANPAAELEASYAVVKQHRSGVAAMSFPHGAWTPALVAQARQAGFELIFTSEPSLVLRPAGAGRVAMPLGRIHLPENAWTCSKGVIDPAKLASFLFGRAHASASQNS